MSEYEIMRWDAVIPKDNTLPYPMIYIKPDKKFLDYVEESKNIFSLDISDTGMEYDKMPVTGMVDSSGYFPTFRPNFFNETGYYVIVLFTNWIGYPEKNGKIKIQNIIKKSEEKPIIPEPTFPEYYEEPLPPKKCEKLSSFQIGLILISILLIFGVLLGISLRKK
jgi:hypothetical protein